MEPSDSEKRINEIFTDLKKDRVKDGKNINLIDKSRKLVATKNVINFQGDHLKKKIKYNSEFYTDHLSHSSDNVIRFILLHEEGHLANGKNYLLLIFIPLIVIAFVSVLIMYSPIRLQFFFQEYSILISNFVAGVIFFIFMIMITISTSWRFLWDSMYDEEIQCDLYGAESIVENFEERDPLSVAREFFLDDLTQSETKKIELLVIVMKVIGTYPDYHPSVYARLEKIKENFPSIYS